MRDTTTRGCGAHGHPEITLHYHESGVVPSDVSDLIRILEDMVAAGSAFKPGETIQVGWLFAQFRNYGHERLTLYEPDLKGFPVSWTLGVTNTLTIKRAQLDVADSFGLREKAEFTTFRHACLACTEYRDGDDFFMMRWAPEAMASGWFIGCLDRGHDHDDTANLLRISTYELITRISRNPLIYLALPADVIVEVRNGLPQAGLPDRGLPIAPGSFLHALYERSGRAV